MVMAKWTDIQGGILDESVVIDFEGFEDEDPSLCGVWMDREFEQVVFDKALEPAARYTAEEEGRRVYYKNRDEFLKGLIETVQDEGRLFIAFSERELEVLQNYDDEIGERYVNALPVARKWRIDHYPSEAEEAVENRKMWKRKLETSKEARGNYFNKVGFRLVDYLKLAKIN